MKNILFLFLLTTTLGFGQDWTTDLNEAKKIAQEHNRTIVLVFQGSDWCAPCIKLDREVWSQESFRTYAKDHYVMLQADFPRKKKNALPEAQQQANNALAERYNRNGIFPLVVVLDAEGNPLGTTSYKKLSPTAYIDLLNSFKG